MAFSKANKAILRAKYGEQVVDAIIAAENVFLGDGSGGEISLVEKLTALLGGDDGKSVRAIATEVLAAAGKLERKIVESVDAIETDAPAAEKYIYMVKRTSGKSGDKYDEYMVIGGEVERVGDWEVDLTNYIQKVSSAQSGNLAAFTEGGGLTDSGVAASDITAAKAVTDKLSANADTLKDIDATAVAGWNSAAHVYVSPTTPEGLKNGDLWLQTF